MKKCPFIGKKCSAHDCAFYTHLVGMNPQTGQPTDEWKCAIAWLPVMLVENANMTRQATASTDKVATTTKSVGDAINLMHKSFCGVVKAGLEMKERKLLEEKRDEP